MPPMARIARLDGRQWWKPGSHRGMFPQAASSRRVGCSAPSPGNRAARAPGNEFRDEVIAMLEPSDANIGQLVGPDSPVVAILAVGRRVEDQR